MRLLLVIGIVCALCVTASADSGQQHNARAKALYHDGKYREAHAEFAAGFDADKLPAFMFNMAECSRLVGDVDLSRDEYTKYLALDPAGKLAPVAKQRLAALPSPKPAPAPAPTPTAPPATPPSPTNEPGPAAASTDKPTVPTPAVAAANVEAARPAPALQPLVDQPTPLWKRKSVWIAVGLVVVGGTVATIAATHHSSACVGTCLDWSMKP